MKTQIIVAIHRTGGSARITKLVTDDSGKFVAKFALTSDGTWREVKELCEYPPDSVFEISKYVLSQFHEQCDAWHAINSPQS